MMKLIKFNQYFKFARSCKKPLQPNIAKEQKSMASQLSDRCLISIQGPEAKKILQGITTNDMQQISKNDKLAALYTGFLNIKGRLIADAIIIKPRVFTQGKLTFKEDEYWLDVHKQQKDNLIKHISKYCWKKQVKVSDFQNDIKICVIYNEGRQINPVNHQTGMLIQPKDFNKGKDQNYANISFVDPRLSDLGIRMIVNDVDDDSDNFQIVTTEDYNSYKTLLGVVDSPLMVDKIPFQFNMDLLGGISFNKGCYIGQELISRSYHTGIVRRRAFPFLVQSEAQANNLEVGQTILQDGIQIGKILEFEQARGIGLALLNYTGMKSFDELKVQSPAKMTIFNPLQQQIQMYLQSVSQKQATIQKLEQ